MCESEGCRLYPCTKLCLFGLEIGRETTESLRTANVFCGTPRRFANEAVAETYHGV